MPDHPGQFEIEIPEAGEQVSFICPGESSPISRAIHLARLNAGWAACADCVCRNERHSADTRFRRRNNHSGNQKEIRRTAFGVRGAYINAIDRFRAAQLATIFSTQLQRSSQDTEELTSTEHTEEQSSAGQQHRLNVVVGFDGRRGAADIFAGVLSAVRQNGCNVVDAGRSTAASLLHVCRLNRELDAAMLITGSGCRGGDTGIDVFLSDGQTISIPWQEFGVATRLNSETESVCSNDESDAVQSALRRIRSRPSMEEAARIERLKSQHSTRLILPKLAESAERLFRSNRHSGSETTYRSEDAYRKWLLRWWPTECGIAVTIRVADDVTSDRLRWLATELSLNLIVGRVGDSHGNELISSDDVHAKPQARLSFLIDEDDRFMTVQNARGQNVSVSALSGWINSSPRTTAKQVTAHATDSADRILLVDIAPPESGRQHDVISDSLATAGFVLNLVNNGRNPLP